MKEHQEQSYFLKYAERLNIDTPVILTGGNKSISLIENIYDQEKVIVFPAINVLIYCFRGKWPNAR